MAYELVWDFEYLGWYAAMALFYVVIYIGSIVMHEIGHVFYFWVQLNRKVRLHIKSKLFNTSKSLLRIEVGTSEDYNYLSDEEYRQVLAWGILMGSVPILYAGALFFPAFLMSIPYFIGCLPDIRNLMELEARRQG